MLVEEEFYALLLILVSECVLDVSSHSSEHLPELASYTHVVFLDDT